MPYMSPGGAATDAILKLLTEREATKQQQFRNQQILLQNELDKQREERLNRQESAQEEYNRIQSERLNKKEDEADKEKFRADVRQELASHVKGDYFTPEFIDRVHKAGLEDEAFGPDWRASTKPQVKLAPSAEVPGVGSIPQPVVTPPQPLRFAGTATERKLSDQRAKEEAAMQEYMSGTPQMEAIKKNPVATEMWWRSKTGGSPLPAALLKQNTGPETEVLVDPVKHTIHVWNAQTAQYEPLKPGQTVPEGAHYNVVPQPPSPTQIIQTDTGFQVANKATGTSKPILDSSGKPVQPKLAAQIQNKMDTAQVLIQQMPEIRAEMEDLQASGQLGPVMGRFNEFLEGKVGSTGNPALDAKLNKFRNDMQFVRGAMQVIHYGLRTSTQGLTAFKDNLNAGKMSYDALKGGLDSYESWAQKYAQNPNSWNTTGAAETPSSTEPKKLSDQDLNDIISGVLKPPTIKK